ncbi:hypothetical protein BDZ45DRAFT_801055 [Acephala macrosclerotiorum]|nr:hypothetical protein BDZ45DRAFT_801055 [Acephala macrosclerotiorum]
MLHENQRIHDLRTLGRLRQDRSTSNLTIRIYSDNCWREFSSKHASALLTRETSTPRGHRATVGLIGSATRSLFNIKGHFEAVIGLGGPGPATKFKRDCEGQEMKHEEKRAPEAVEEESTPILRNTTSRSFRPSATWVLLVLNTCGVMAMILSIEWWNQILVFWPSSTVMQTVIKIWKWSMPSFLLDGTKDIPSSAIFGLWTIATIIFSTTLVGYLMGNKEGKSADKLSWIRIMVLLCVCISIGVTAEEVGLIFMPLTLSCEMALSSFRRNK